jgi:hypothetical protein
MASKLYTGVKWFYALIASLMIGVVANVVIFFGLAFLFAGARGDSWVRWYFGTADGLLFVFVSVLIALPTVSFTRKMNIAIK